MKKNDCQAHFESNKRKWDKRAKTYNNKRFNYFRVIQRKVIKHTCLSENDIFLDIGCGTGWATLHAASFLKSDKQAYGIDLSEGMIEVAKGSAKETGKQVNFQVANAEELPFEDNTFSVIICTNSFHHYPRPEKVLQEMKRTLKHNGKVFILDPTRDSIFMERINERTQKKESEHITFYSSREFQQMYDKCGFATYRCKRILGPLKLHVAKTKKSRGCKRGD